MEGGDENYLHLILTKMKGGRKRGIDASFSSHLK